jgi:hypothetical protein
MAHSGYTGIDTLSVCGVSLANKGIRSAFVQESCGQDISPADNDLYGKGALQGNGQVAWGVELDEPAHGVSPAATGSTTWKQYQGATAKTTTIANCVVSSIRDQSVAKGAGRARSSIAGSAYSSDGSTSPVTRAA